MATFTNGCTYQFTQYGKPITCKLLRHDPITNQHVVTTNGRDEWAINLHALGSRVRRVRPTKKKTDTSQVYLYMCTIGANTYKVGATCAPEQRRKQIRTYTPLAKMKLFKVPPAKGARWAQLEKTVLRRFAAHRPPAGGSEVLHLTTEQATECAGYMRSVCAGA